MLLHTGFILCNDHLVFRLVLLWKKEKSTSTFNVTRITMTFSIEVLDEAFSFVQHGGGITSETVSGVQFSPPDEKI